MSIYHNVRVEHLVLYSHHLCICVYYSHHKNKRHRTFQGQKSVVSREVLYLFHVEILQDNMVGGIMMLMLVSYAINTQQKAESAHCFDVTAHVQTP